MGSTTRETRHPPSLTLYQSAFHPSSTTLRARLKTLLLQTFGYVYKFKTDDKEFVGNCSDVDIDNDAQEEENEVKGIHEPFEDMDCFQVSLLILFLFVIDFVFVF